MRKFWFALTLVPAIAHADVDGFVEGVVGYSSPIAGDQYSDAVEGSARVGLRGGWTPLRLGSARVGLEAVFDWRPVSVANETASELRTMIGPRLVFAAAPCEVFFRATAGYDYFNIGSYTNHQGYAIEPGFGASYRHKNLLFSADVATPIIIHTQQTGADYMDGFAGADIQLTTSVGATF